MVFITIDKGDTMTLKEKKQLAETISKNAKWDGSDILDILQIALEDANFHTLVAELDTLREKHQV